MELATAYLNPSPQLTAYVNQLSGLPTRPNPNSDLNLEIQDGSSAWALNRRLSRVTRKAIVTAFQAGTRQQVLADRHGISLSSVKRVIRAGKA